MKVGCMEGIRHRKRGLVTITAGRGKYYTLFVPLACSGLGSAYYRHMQAANLGIFFTGPNGCLLE